MGVHQKGIHVPLCVFTNNVGRRSPQKLEERKQKQKQRSWFIPQWSQSSQERWQSRPEEWQGWQADADPQQGWQPRPEGRPAVAGGQEPRNGFDRWRERSGRRGRTELRSSDSDALGGAKCTAAVAARSSDSDGLADPMKVGIWDARNELPMKVGISRLWCDAEPDDPAAALRYVVHQELVGPHQHEMLALLDR